MASYFKSKKLRSVWREYAFMLKQLQRAIEPQIDLLFAIENWNQIAIWLAESKRKRMGFVGRYNHLIG